MLTKKSNLITFVNIANSFRNFSKTVVNHGKVGLYAGSFDPPTQGHLDIISRSADICSKMYVGVAVNPDKKHVFSLDERVDFMRRITKKLNGDFTRIEVASFTGLVVDFAKEKNVDFLIRGLRAYSDFEAEFRMALVNRKLTGIETIFLMSDEKLSHVSSTLIRQLTRVGRYLPNFVPPEIEEDVLKRLLPQKN